MTKKLLLLCGLFILSGSQEGWSEEMCQVQLDLYGTQSVPCASLRVPSQRDDSINDTQTTSYTNCYSTCGGDQNCLNDCRWEAYNKNRIQVPEGTPTQDPVPRAAKKTDGGDVQFPAQAPQGEGKVYGPKDCKNWDSNLQTCAIDDGQQSGSASGGAEKPAQQNAQAAQGAQPAGGNQPAPSDQGDTSQTTQLTDRQNANQISNEAQGKLAECKSAQVDARTCCTNPLACVAGIKNGGDLAGGIANAGVGALLGHVQAGGLSSGDVASVKHFCDVYRDVGNGTAALNAALGAKCQTEMNSCSDSCSAVLADYQSRRMACTGSASCGILSQSALDTAINQIQNYKNQCDSYTVYVQRFAGQAIASASGASIGSICSNASLSALNNGGLNFNQQPITATDCTNPANASNPLCTNGCTGPNAANNPLCVNPNTIGQNNNGGGVNTTTNSAANYGDGTGGKGSGNFNVGLDQTPTQGAVTANVQAKASQANPIPGGGAAGLPGSSGSTNGFGPSNNDGQRYYGGGEQSHDVLQGLFTGAGGGSATVSAVPVAEGGGGFSGYSGSGLVRAPNGQMVDLRSYLPGEKNDPHRRFKNMTPSEEAQIAPRSSNIFENLHRRYCMICAAGRAIGCNGGVKVADCLKPMDKMPGLGGEGP